jgi:hypothetical protein
MPVVQFGIVVVAGDDCVTLAWRQVGDYGRMNWPWRVVVIVPVSSLAVAEVAARAINSTGPEYAGQAFSMQLSASGDSPATHVGLYTSATDEMLTKMNAALPSVPGVMFWRHDTNGILAASNVTVPSGQTWGWTDSIGSVGLKRILPPPYPEATVNINIVPAGPNSVRLL